MKLYLNVSPNFYRFAPHILRQVSQSVPEMSFSAMVQGGGPVYESFVARTSGLNAMEIANFNELERKWLDSPGDLERLREYEKRLGGNAVNRIIVADRFVGWRYVTGGEIPKAPLATYCEDDVVRAGYVCGLLDYLFEVFETNKPDVVLTYAVAGAFTMALSLVAKHFGVEYRRLHEIRLGNRCILDSSFLNMADPIKALYERSLADESLVSGSREAAKEILAKMRSEPTVPDYYKIVKSKVFTLPPLKDFAALLWWELKGRPQETLADPYYMDRFFWELKRYFRAKWIINRKPFLQWTSGKNKVPFVYFPLHFDPEATTMVLAPHATNQLALLEALSKAIPAGWDLLVKDHFTMLGRRPADFYSRLKQIPKVKVVDPSVSSFELISHSEFVAVVTGTAAWEAMQMGKPALCMGGAHFQNVGHGFVVEENLNNLASAVEATIDLSPAPDRNLELYIAAMLEASFPLPGEILNDVSISDEFLENQEETISAIVQGVIEAHSIREAAE